MRYMLKPATLLKVTVLHGCFSRFLNCKNGTKSRKTSHMMMTPHMFNLCFHANNKASIKRPDACFIQGFGGGLSDLVPLVQF